MGVPKTTVDEFLDLQRRLNAAGIPPFGQKVGVPASATASGTPGYWAVDTSYFYVYTGDGITHTWRRVAVTSW